MWDAIGAHPQGAKRPGSPPGRRRQPGAMADPLTCDVAIVGAGIAGAILARRLAEAGVDVVVLEAGEATGLTWEGYQDNIRQFLGAAAKVPNSAWPNSPAAPSPNVLDIGPLTPAARPAPPATSCRWARSRSAATTNAAAAARRCTGTATASACSLPTSRCTAATASASTGRSATTSCHRGTSRRSARSASPPTSRTRSASGCASRPGYVYPMHKVPPSYLDRWLGERLDGFPVAIGDGTYETGVVPVPGGRNSTPNPAYDGGAGYTPVGAVGTPGDRSALRGQRQLHPGLPGAGQVLGAEDARRGRRGRRPRSSTRRSPPRSSSAPPARSPGSTTSPGPATRSPSAVAGTITAERYVLAAHSVENAKLLLMSAPPTPAIRSGAT